jgi:hypothetical protein
MLVAALGCFLSLTLAFGRPGDAGIQGRCERSSWSTFRTPQAAAAGDGEIKAAKTCTADARRRVHVVLALLPFSVLLGAAGSLRFAATPAAAPSATAAPKVPRRAPQKAPSKEPPELQTPEPHSNMRTIPPTT